jgi:tRNA (cmo5U34)-methyltransferase
MSKDTGYAPPKWEFDDEVTRVFEDMLWRSIPAYAEMRSLCHQVASKFRKDGSTIVDLGCSRGGAIAKLVEEDMTNTYLGVEVSEPMIVAARQRFSSMPNVKIERVDLRSESLPVEPGAASVVQAVLTLQFIPIEYRQRVVRDAHLALSPGGIVILVEKILGSNSVTNDFLVDAYYGFKRSNGYTQDDIDRKRFALEGVLVPQTERANVEMLNREGFRDVECFWRYLNFAAWVAIK